MSIAGLSLLAALRAAPPEGAALVEAENFKAVKNAEVRGYSPGAYAGVPSGGKMLRISRGSAETEIDIPAEGDYKIHLRFLLSKDVDFLTRLEKDGLKIAEEAVTASTTLAQEKHSSFVWSSIGARLPKGKIKIVLERRGANIQDFDCVVTSPASANHTPVISDFFAPLYVSVKSDSEQPFYLHMWGRLPRPPWGIGHFNISKKGLFAGPGAGTEDASAIIMRGESSPWVNIAPHLTEVGDCKLLFYAMTKYPDPHKSASFTLSFSTTPSADGLIGSASRSGQGGGLRCSLNLGEKKVATSAEESVADRKRAENAGDMPGGRAVKFPIGTGLELDSAIDSADVIGNELAAMEALGLNMLKCDYGLSREGLLEKHGISHKFDAFPVFHLAAQGCLSAARDDFEAAITKRVEEMKNSKALDKTVVLLLMDEPRFPLVHLMKCDRCKGGFANFLAKNKVSLGGSPAVTDKRDSPEAYYWTIRYRNSILTEFFRKASEVVHKTAPGLPTGVNIANALFTNMLEDGCDWFELYRTGALTYGWSEDWINQHTSFQLCGYMADVMRSACRGGKIPFGVYNILSRTSWEIEAKAFTELGHGVRAMQFFNYGPHYAANGDFASQREDAHRAMKSVARAVGGVDDMLARSSPMRGDAAMLYSTDSDIWNMGHGSLRGRERSLLHLLLRHSGIRTDIVFEGDLADELPNYKVLFAADSHVEKKSLETILDWVRNGGRLFLLPGALASDNLNKPSSFDFQRGALTVQEKGDYHARRLDKAPRVSSVKFDGQDIPAVHTRQELSGKNVLFKNDDGTPAVTREPLGKGDVTAFGFLPGHAYAAGGSHEGEVAASEKKYFSCVSYKEAPRKMMRELIGESVAPHVETDNHLVEANALDCGGDELLVIANWSGKKQKTDCLVRGEFESVTSVKKGAELQIQREPGKTRITLDVEAGDMLVLKKKRQ